MTSIIIIIIIIIELKGEYIIPVPIDVSTIFVNKLVNTLSLHQISRLICQAHHTYNINSNQTKFAKFDLHSTTKIEEDEIVKK